MSPETSTGHRLLNSQASFPQFSLPSNSRSLVYSALVGAADFELRFNDDDELKPFCDSSPPVYELSLSDYHTSRFPDLDSDSMPPGMRTDHRTAAIFDGSVNSQFELFDRQPLLNVENNVSHHSALICCDDKMTKWKQTQSDCNAVNKHKQGDIQQHRSARGIFKPPFPSVSAKHHSPNKASSVSGNSALSNKRSELLSNSSKRKRTATPSSLFTQKLSKLCQQR